jgi:hypothetical protein
MARKASYGRKEGVIKIDVRELVRAWAWA